MPKKKSADKKYDSSNIQVLKGLEAVKKRPGMYIGDTDDGSGLHHMIFEVVDNCIDEAMAGHCSKIDIIINKDESITVKDNGRGIPVDTHKGEGVPAAELIMTTLHSGGKFDDNSYKVSGGLHGVGVSVVNALSTNLLAEVRRDGSLWRQTFARGVPASDLEKISEATDTGTRVTFTADPEIFETVIYDRDVLAKRLKELSYLNAGIYINFTDERRDDEKRVEEYHFPDGLEAFIREVNSKRASIYEEVIRFQIEVDNVMVDVAMQHNDGYSQEQIFTFANNINTHHGGTHLSGFKSALTRTLNKFCKDMKMLKNDNPPDGKDYQEGLAAVVSVKLPDPQFEGQTKEKLGNTEIEGIVQSLVNEALGHWIDMNPAVGKKIVNKALEAARAREAARKARDLTRRKGLLSTGSLPGKVHDCRSRNNAETYLVIVEGDSAGGTAKQGRDRRTQAILPLRGKVINSEKAREDKLLANNEIQSIITALGCGFGEDEEDPNSFNPEKLRYHKVVIMTDADVDGSHIRTLLLTFFWRKMKSLVQGGFVYMAMPPLYKIKQGRKERYAYTDEERDVVIQRLESENESAKINIQRYKGLGEMNAEQLWDTTMNAETRSLMQVTVDHIQEEETNVRFRELMGTEVEHRRKFITEKAKFATNIDI